MSRNYLLFFILLLLLSCVFSSRLYEFDVKAPASYPVHNLNTGLNYTTIQEAIDANETTDEHTILVDAGIYYEHVDVNKSISLIGYGDNRTVIDGNGTDNAIHIVSNNVTVAKFRVQNSGQTWPSSNGIYVDSSNNTRIENVTAQDCRWGISVYESDNCLLADNIVENCSQWGIWMWRCFDCTADNNTVFKSIVGIKFEESSNCVMSNNLAVNNTAGLQLWTTTDCSIIANTMIGNNIGIHLIYSENEVMHYNNFLNNEAQANCDFAFGNNTWDIGLEGNHWSDYNGIDNNQDGIGDTPYTIDANNIDHCPLMGAFQSFNVDAWNHSPPVFEEVDVISNSTIYFVGLVGGVGGNLDWFVDFFGHGQNETGFCRATVPNNIINMTTYPIYVSQDDENIGGTSIVQGRIVESNSTHATIYFTYNQTFSNYQLEIFPEFPSFLILPLFFMTTLLSALIYKKRRHRLVETQ